MGEATNAVPEVKQSVVAHLIVRGAAKALEFYAEALGATEIFRAPTPDGRLMHASMMIGDSWVYLCDEFPEHNADHSTGSPQALGGTPVVLHLNVPDVDASFARAVAAGATPAMPPADMFWGARYGQVVDPFGHRWSMATPLAGGAPSAEEIARCAVAEGQPAVV
ncbi:MAG TPA: VOC family protein [Isosphaeraceae bacterium]